MPQLAAALAGQYDLEREIGRGGMGIVYLARDVRLDRAVAIKTLPAHLVHDPIVRERFLREARTAANLSHQNIVPVHRADDLGGYVFFVMGFVDGESIAQRIRSLGRIDQHELLREMRDVALALDYAHSRGVVHRDIKAENILIDRATGRAMVTDFGIARLAEAAPLTATGQVLGTVYYLSPEQVAGEAVDGRSDIYALGVAAFFALSGRFPFDAPLASAVLVAHITKEPPPLLSVASDVEPMLAAIVDRCLRKDPSARFQRGADLARELSGIERDVERTPTAESRALVSDREAQEIWRRAAELQDATSSQPRPPMPVAVVDRASAPTSGYVVSDVRGAAREAGIATKSIDRALAEHGLATGGAEPSVVTINDLTEQSSRFLGGPVVIEYEAAVGGEVSEQDFDVLGDVIRRRAAGDGGTLTAVGRSLNWASTGDNRRFNVSITARRGKTTIRCTENLGRLSGLTFGPGMGIGGMLGGGMVFAAMIGNHHAALGLVAWSCILTTAYGIARRIYSTQSTKRRSQMRDLAEELAAEIRDSIAGRA
jgi:serine/threonine protein kinase